MWRTDRQTDRQTTSCDSDMHNAYHRAVIKTTMIVMMMMMMMMMQVYVESNESNFVHQLVVNSSLTDVHIDNLPDNISSYVVQVSAFNRVASSPHSRPVLVGQSIHIHTTLFLFFVHLLLLSPSSSNCFRPTTSSLLCCRKLE